MVDMPAKTCVVCGIGLAEQHGRARPYVYCSISCRRLAENRVRRLSRTLERIDDELLVLDRQINGHDFRGSEVGRQQLIKKAEYLRTQRDDAERELVRYDSPDAEVSA